LFVVSFLNVNKKVANVLNLNNLTDLRRQNKFTKGGVGDTKQTVSKLFKQCKYYEIPFVLQ